MTFIREERRIVVGLFILFAFASMYGCRDDSSSPELDPDPDELIINPNTRDIDSQEWLNYIQEIDSSNFTISFDENFEVANDWQEGDLLVSAEGLGLLRTVADVSQSDGTIIISTEQATLVDYIHQGEIHETVSLEIDDVEKVKYFIDGVKLLTNPGEVQQNKLYKEKRRGLPWDLDTDFTSSSGAKIEIYGDYLLETDLTLDAKITWFAQLQHFEMSYELKNTIELGLRASSELQVSSSVKLAEVTFSPVLFSIPPVPVVITPKLIVNLGIDGEITGEIVTNVNYQNSLRVGSRFERSIGWREIMDREDDFSFNPPTIELEAEMEAYLNPEFEMALYGVLSGYMSASLYSEVEADIDRDPWWEIFLGIRAGVGTRATVLNKELIDHSKPDLLDVRWSIAKAEADILPTVTTVSVDQITNNGATVVGEVERPSGAGPIVERGVCWSEEENPTLDDECIENGDGEGNFVVDITNLNENTKYYVTAYATNNSGTRYGNQLNFATGIENLIVESAPPFEGSNFDIAQFAECDEGLKNSSADYNSNTASTQIELIYNFEPPCIDSALSLAGVTYEKISTVKLENGTPIKAKIKYRINTINAETDEGQIEHEFEIWFDLTDQDTSPLPNISFPDRYDDGLRVSQPSVIDKCKAKGNSRCEPQGDLKEGEHIIEFIGEVRCNGAPSPCSLPDLRMGIDISAELIDEAPASGSATFDVDIISLEFIDITQN